MIKLRKAEVEMACAYWLRAQGYENDKRRKTDPMTPVAIDTTQDVICTMIRSGVQCVVIEKKTQEQPTRDSEEK